MLSGSVLLIKNLAILKRSSISTISAVSVIRHILSVGSLDKQDMEIHRVKELVRRNFCPPVSIDVEESEVIHSALNQNFVPIVDSRNTLCGILTLA